MDRRLSIAAFQRAERSIVGGVNSPVRSFSAVGGSPVLVKRGKGPYLYDIDGNRYIDYLMSWGAIILGHAHPVVQAAIEEQTRQGTGYGLTTEVESELAKIIKEAFPSIDLVRLVNSGTEAVMSALRLARGFTKRDGIVTFEGCYHGHGDALLCQAGSGLATFAIPRSEGVPSSFIRETYVAKYNDLDSVETIFKKYGAEIACILVEPVAGNMGVVPPRPGFLEGLRNVTDRTGALLIFDEVITGFRIAWGGAQERFGIRPDLTILGKIIGGGLPVGAFGGRRDIMENLAPIGNVYQAGTLAGNPIVASAGAATLKTLKNIGPYAELESLTTDLVNRIRDVCFSKGISLQINQVGPMFTCFFSPEKVTDCRSARKSDTKRWAAFFRDMLEAGVLLPPSQFEAAFLSTAHSQDDIDITVKAVQKAL